LPIEAKDRSLDLVSTVSCLASFYVLVLVGMPIRSAGSGQAGLASYVNSAIPVCDNSNTCS